MAFGQPFRIPWAAFDKVPDLNLLILNNNNSTSLQFQIHNSRFYTRLTRDAGFGCMNPPLRGKNASLPNSKTAAEEFKRNPQRRIKTC